MRGPGWRCLDAAYDGSPGLAMVAALPSGRPKGPPQRLLAWRPAVGASSRRAGPAPAGRGETVGRAPPTRRRSAAGRAGGPTPRAASPTGEPRRARRREAPRPPRRRFPRRPRVSITFSEWSGSSADRSIFVKNGALRWAEVAIGVVDLDRVQPVGERRNLLHLVQRQAGQEAEPDPATQRVPPVPPARCHLAGKQGRPRLREPQLPGPQERPRAAR